MDKISVFLVISIIFNGVLLYQKSDIKEQLTYSQSEFLDCEEEIEKKQSKIEECNDNIISAKNYEGSSFEEMETALNYLDYCE